MKPSAYAFIQQTSAYGILMAALAVTALVLLAMTEPSLACTTPSCGG